MSKCLSSFPIISDDLRCEETILQASRNLNNLKKLFENTIQSITSVIDANGKKISDISNRLVLIDYKINQIKGSKKAIQIYSGSKYPVKKPDSISSVRSRNILNDKLSFVNINEPLENKKNFSYKSLDDSALKNRQHYYRVDNIFDQKISFDAATQGLGELLSDPVTSVSSLLLFNTAQHV